MFLVFFLFFHAFLVCTSLLIFLSLHYLFDTFFSFFSGFSYSSSTSTLLVLFPLCYAFLALPLFLVLSQSLLTLLILPFPSYVFSYSFVSAPPLLLGVAKVRPRIFDPDLRDLPGIRPQNRLFIPPYTWAPPPGRAKEVGSGEGV